MKRLLPIAALVLLSLTASAAHAQKIIAIGDEWTLSDNAFSTNAANTTQFAQNIAAELAGGVPNANFLAYSSNFGLTGGSLASTMTGAGYGWTVGTAQPFTFATLQNYKAVFLCGIPGSGTANSAILSAYVNGGGNVLVMGGAGEHGGAADEANAWNPFLNAFGLGFGNSYFETPGVVGVGPTASTNPLQSGISSITWGYGQEAYALNPTSLLTDTAITGQFSTNHSIVATYNIGAAVVPEAGTLFLLLPALGIVGAVITRRKNKTK